MCSCRLIYGCEPHSPSKRALITVLGLGASWGETLGKKWSGTSCWAVNHGPRLSCAFLLTFLLLWSRYEPTANQNKAGMQSLPSLFYARWSTAIDIGCQARKLNLSHRKTVLFCSQFQKHKSYFSACCLPATIWCTWPSPAWRLVPECRLGSCRVAQ